MSSESLISSTIDKYSDQIEKHHSISQQTSPEAFYDYPVDKINWANANRKFTQALVRKGIALTMKEIVNNHFIERKWNRSKSTK